MSTGNNTATVVGDQNTSPTANTRGVFYFKTAILVDGGWFSSELVRHFPNCPKHPTAEQIYKHVISILSSDEILMKLFYYDSMPYEGQITNPITRREVNLISGANARKNFFSKLGIMPNVALRRGEVRFGGWKLRKEYQEKLISGNNAPLTEADIQLDFEQKGVDMRIGIDIASLSLKKIVDRIILFSGDSDMIPAMKLARIEGVQVVVVQIGKGRLKEQLIEDSDFLRILK